MTKKLCFITRLLATVLAVVMLSSAVYLAVEATMTAPATTVPSAARSASARIC